MGGFHKGLLALQNGQTILERLTAEVRIAAPDAPLFLIGEARPYQRFRLPVLTDFPAGIGPLGGLRALLELARLEERPGALALACDLPFLSAALIRRLLFEHPDAVALAPQIDGFWSTLTARYSVASLTLVQAAIQAGELRLQSLFDRVGSSAVRLSVNQSERLELRDWDTPEDRRA